MLHIAHASTAELKKPLKVIFLGEEGIDEGGVRKEFFQLISSQLFDLDYGMFTAVANNRAIWPNKDNSWSEAEYTLVGALLGLALYNGILLDVHFPAVFYKKLLLGADVQLSYSTPSTVGATTAAAQEVSTMGDVEDATSAESNIYGISGPLPTSIPTSPYTLEDLATIDIDLYRGLHELSIYEPASDIEFVFCRNFTIEYEEFGARREFELLRNGRNIALNGENRYLYITLYINFFCHHSISSQFQQLYIGFTKVISASQLLLLSPTELEVLMIGDKDATKHFNFTELEPTTIYVGESNWNADHPTVRWFWEVVHNFSISEKEKFLCFVTGSNKAPIGGLGKLGFKLQRMGPDSESLPTAHTCFNVLLLPEYTSKEKLANRLTIAIHECEGFGLK